MRAGSAGCVNALRAAGAPLSLQAVRVAAEGDTLELLTLLLEGLAVEDLLQVLASAEEEPSRAGTGGGGKLFGIF